MKLHDRVNILGQEISVEYSDKVPDNHNANYDYNKILIHPKCKKKDLARSFLHEFFHAVCERGSISQGIDGDTEEIIVDLMAKALTENFHIRWK
jgi:hypothetical protein